MRVGECGCIIWLGLGKVLALGSNITLAFREMLNVYASDLDVKFDMYRFLSFETLLLVMRWKVAAFNDPDNPDSDWRP